MTERDWGLCKQTFDLLCTLTRIGLKFRCPLEKVIKFQMQDDRIERIETEVYRRSIK